MFYSIQHTTQFRYDAQIRESTMELRMQPRSEGSGRCLSFDLHIAPRPRVFAYRDCWNNLVHAFDVPGFHQELEIKATAIVENVGEGSTPSVCTWADLDAATNEDDFWDFLLPSKFARRTERLTALIQEWQIARRDDPLSLLNELSEKIYRGFEYVPSATRADSPIDEALEGRRGVCQDFTHIFIAAAREIGIPCRYVSGYLYHGDNSRDRSVATATHAWPEAWLPGNNWIGFDPTNNLLTAERHIRTAVGRDYADVPPTRGVFKGRATTDLSVAVEVKRISAPSLESLAPAPPEMMPQAVSGVTAAVWPPPSTILQDEVSEQAQQQQQARQRITRSPLEIQLSAIPAQLFVTPYPTVCERLEDQDRWNENDDGR